MLKFPELMRPANWIVEESAAQIWMEANEDRLEMFRICGERLKRIPGSSKLVQTIRNIYKGEAQKKRRMGET